MGKLCSCRCHKVKLHDPSCAIIQAGSLAIKKKIKCSCVPHYNKSGLCTDCFKNHPDHEHYKTAQYGSEIAGRF